MGIAHSILDLIGSTPLLALERYVPGGRVLAKLESFNPLSSAKDRAALYMIRDAEERGVLKPGATIVEPTSGNTGVGLSYIGRILGYRVVLTMPAAEPSGRSGGRAGPHRGGQGHVWRHRQGQRAAGDPARSLDARPVQQPGQR